MTKEKHFQVVEGLPEELKTKLKEDYGADPLDIEDVFTYTQLAKIEAKRKYVYIALHFPEYDPMNRHFTSKEVHCFINNSKILIIDKDSFSFIKDFQRIYEHQIKTWEPIDIFYEMLDYMVTRLFKVIGKFQLEVKSVESQIFNTQPNEDLLLEILIIKRNLINYISIISPLYKMLTELETKYTDRVNTKGLEKIDDSLDKIEKILNNLANSREQITLIKETRQTLIARSTNQTVKKLTGINLLVFVPTLITSFFGMNVYFGWIDRTNSLLPVIAILVLMVVLTTASYMYFKQKDWI